MTDLSALPGGTVLAGDYQIDRVLGAGGFGVTYLADEAALSRRVSIKEYFPSDFALRSRNGSATPRSENCKGDYSWGLERFLDEAQTLAKFDHPNIVRVYRIFRANNTAYMVLQFEEGQSLKSWLKGLRRAPRQKELDQIVAPLLDALAVIHRAEFLHRDIAPDNIIIRSSGDPVLIDFGAARSDIAAHSKTKTVSALVKPGYSPYEQYAETSKQQGPWTDIYALAATLYHAVTGKRPPDSPSRMLKDEMVPAREAALSSYRSTFLDAIQHGLALKVEDRPQSVAAWKAALLAPLPAPEKQGVIARLKERTEIRRGGKPNAAPQAAIASPPAETPAPVETAKQDGGRPQGGLLDRLRTPAAQGDKKAAQKKSAAKVVATPAEAKKNFGKAAAPAVAALSPSAQREERKRVRLVPMVKRRRSLSREIKTKVMVALAVTLAGFVFKDQIAMLAQPLPSGVTTGAIGGSVRAARHGTSGDAQNNSGKGSQFVEAQSFRAHGGSIAALAYSGNGRLIVSTGSDRTLKVWDAQTHALKGATTLEDGAATSLSVRNNRVVTGHPDGTVAVYDLDTLNRLYSFRSGNDAVSAVAFAGSEDVVASAGGNATTAFWQTGTPSEPILTLDGQRGTVQALAADPSGRWLASGSSDAQVKLWNLQTHNLRRTLRGLQGAATVLSFSPDGSRIAAGAANGSVRLWSAATGRGLRTLSGHASRITALALSPGNTLLASADEQGIVRVRGLKHRGIYGALSAGDEGARAVAFDNDGQVLLTGGIDGMVRIWPIPQPLLAQRD